MEKHMVRPVTPVGAQKESHEGKYNEQGGINRWQMLHRSTLHSYKSRMQRSCPSDSQHDEVRANVDGTQLLNLWATGAT